MDYHIIIKNSESFTSLRERISRILLEPKKLVCIILLHIITINKALMENDVLTVSCKGFWEFKE